MPQFSSQDGLGFFIGPLKKTDPDKLANRLFRLFNSVGIKCTDVAMVSVNPHEGFAKVQLISATVEDYALKIFQDIRAVMDLYDLRLLMEKPQQLKVERIRSREKVTPWVSDSSKSIRIVADDQSPNNETRLSNYTPVTDLARTVLLKPSRREEGGGGREPGIVDDDNLDGYVRRSPHTSLGSRPEHVYNVISLSQTSSSSPSPAGFEELEEDLEDYCEGCVLPEKPNVKTRSMQTSGASSSSSVVDCSSQQISLEQPASPKNTFYAPLATRSATDGNCQESNGQQSPLEFGWYSSPTLDSGTDRRAMTSFPFDNEETFAFFNSLAPKEGGGLRVRGEFPVRLTQRDKRSDSFIDGSPLNGRPRQGMSFPDKLDNTQHGVDFVKHDMIKTAHPEKARHAQEAPQMVHAKTSTHAVRPCFYSGTSFYHRGQTLEVSGRNIYLDLGTLVISDLRTLRFMLGRHVCAFLNSGGGALYFGVDPADTKVKGLPVSHKYEDALRLDIDRQIKLITPVVPTSAYKVNFAKVMSETGHLLPDIRVLEIEVISTAHSPPSSRALHRGSEDEEDREEEEESASYSWPSDADGYRFKDVLYVWEDGKVNAAG